ncbi:MAG: hypothetical protein ABFD16_23145 [Thermoguttaceae bacterium]|jgi:rod shape-determining protein MreD
MRLLFLVPLLYLTAVIQTSLVDLLRIGQVEPDMLALLAVTWLLLVPGPWAFLVAGAIGLAEDLLAVGPTGLGLASFLVVGYGLWRLRTRFRLESLGLQVLVVLLGVSALTSMQAVGHRLLNPSSATFATLQLQALGAGLYTAAVSIPVLMVVSWLREAFKRPQLFMEPDG